MRADSVAEVDRVGYLAAGKIDDGDRAAVGACAAYAGVAVDWNVGGGAVGRSRDFVAGDAVDGNGGDLLAGDWINEAEVATGLVGDQQQRPHCLLSLSRGKTRNHSGNRTRSRHVRKNELFHRREV